ncbi:MAG: AMP-binding protein, partial [Novosphingobium sp.]|nr:AMP-binding protein [Novosphingobium sp.]
MPGFHPSVHARSKPNALALVIADTGETLTYRELDERSNRIAHLFRSLGLEPGDKVGMMVRNSPYFPMVYWAATRSGLFVTLLSTHLKPAEAAYILNDSGAKALVLSASLGDTPRALAAARAELIPDVRAIYYADDEPIAGATSLEQAMADMPAIPVPDEISGFHMIYSSGTTGRPKGVVLPFTPGPIDEFNLLEGAPTMYQQFDLPVTLNVGPLYHGAPLSCMVCTQRLGGTFVTQRKFDAGGVLRAIEQWKVNNA